MANASVSVCESTQYVMQLWQMTIEPRGTAQDMNDNIQARDQFIITIAQ